MVHPHPERGQTCNVTSPARLARAVGDALGAEVVATERLGGGDVAESYRCTLRDGCTVFAKTHADPAPFFFDTEARSLGWLGDAGAIAVPEVRAVGDGRAADDGVEPPFLVLEWINERPGTPTDEAAFGIGLARMHAAGAPTFGRADARTTGSRRLPNDPCESWAEFYATRRLLPLARLAHDAGALPMEAIGALERVAGRLDVVGGPPEPPARLHGDLWAGNRIVDAAGVSWLVDPSAHGGHREFDLAMMRLFGGFGAGAFAAYHEIAPLADGWEDRIALHQLAPLAVHAIKFHGGYVSATEAALRRYA